jgi:hypothetical protein
VEGVGDDFFRGGQDETPIEGNEQFCAPWIVESPGGTVTTSAYNEDGKKRCLSAEEGSGDPRKKVLEQNKTFTRAHRKIGRGLTEDEIRAEAHKRQKEMSDAARAAEMTKEEVALEKRKGLAEKEAARKATTGQAGTVKRSRRSRALGCIGGSGQGQARSRRSQTKRKAATGQASSDFRAVGLAKKLRI